MAKGMSKVEDLPRHIDIRLANNEKLQAKQKGTLRLYKDDLTINIEALIVPNLLFNLLSVRKISSTGKKIIFSENKAEIVTANNLKIDCYAQGKLYIAEFTLTKDKVCYVTETKDIWHKRLGNLNRKSLRKMKLPVSDSICGPCREGKANRLPFKGQQLPMSRKIEELIHTDLGGPIKTPTENGERYYQVITDDYNHFTEVFLLRTKFEAESNLISYIRRIEARFGHKRTSQIRCDNGGEFTSDTFKNFCREQGIKLEYTITYSPQINGVSERLNKTLLDKVRTLFAETNLPRHLWGEAIRTAAYQLNRSATSALFDDIPARVYYGKLDLSKLRVFDAKAWSVTFPKID